MKPDYESQHVTTFEAFECVCLTVEVEEIAVDLVLVQIAIPVEVAKTESFKA